MKFIIYISLILIAFFLSCISCQDYAEYARGAGLPKRKNNRGVVVVSIISGVLGSFIGSWLTSKSLKKKYDKDRKDLLQYIELQNDLYKQRDSEWQKEYTKLYKAYEEIEKESLERDYEEFKAPDTNNDDMITRTEFNTYVKKYLSSFPELSEKDFPTFEEFDMNSDGIVSFDEWQTYLYLQKQKEALEKKSNDKKSSTSDSSYYDLLNALYDQSNSADSFNSLNQNIASNSRGTRRT